jgi:hypothetical protein
VYFLGCFNLCEFIYGVVKYIIPVDFEM